MRIHNLAQLKQLPIGDYHKRQIEKALRESQKEKITRVGGAGGILRSGTPSSPPQQKLLALLQTEMPEHDWCSDYVGAVPGRKYELDIALVDAKLAVEVDGFSHHGLNKANYHRDRDKDYLLALEGWYVLRIQAGLIIKSPHEAVGRVQAFIDAWLPRQQCLLGAGFMGKTCPILPSEEE